MYFNLRLKNRYNRNYLAHKIKIFLIVGRALQKNIECIGKRLQYCPNMKLKLMVQQNILRAWEVFHESCQDRDQQTGKVHLNF